MIWLVLVGGLSAASWLSWDYWKSRQDPPVKHPLLMYVEIISRTPGEGYRIKNVQEPFMLDPGLEAPEGYEVVQMVPNAWKGVVLLNDVKRTFLPLSPTEFWSRTRVEMIVELLGQRETPVEMAEVKEGGASGKNTC